MVTSLSDWITEMSEQHREPPQELNTQMVTDGMHALLREEQIRTVFQPIIRFRDGSVYGYEALSRGPAGSLFESPTVLFSLAEHLGLVWELEYLCRRLAIQRYAAMQHTELLFLNVNPHVLADPRLIDAMTRAPLMRSIYDQNRLCLKSQRKPR